MTNSDKVFLTSQLKHEQKAVTLLQILLTAAIVYAAIATITAVLIAFDRGEKLGVANDQIEQLLTTRQMEDAVPEPMPLPVVVERPQSNTLAVLIKAAAEEEANNAAIRRRVDQLSDEDKTELHRIIDRKQSGYNLTQGELDFVDSIKRNAKR